MTGSVTLKLYKGAATVVARKSDYSLYSEEHVTFEEDAVYDQQDAEGFIKLNALRLKLLDGGEDNMPAPHMPDMLPVTEFDWERLVPFIGSARAAVAQYDGILTGIPNAAVLLSPVTNREAVLSSRIEGTQASLSEVLRHEAGDLHDGEKADDIREILNYRIALLAAEGLIQNRPINLSLITDLHRILMENVRGGDRTPGEFRRSQNWIGNPGCTLEEARFVPPQVLHMHDALQNLEQFIADDFRDPVVQLAIVHAQFEIIHPFNDGNGRLGRMLVPLFLAQKSVLQRPMFYLSEYLEEHDESYRDHLLNITEKGQWQAWVEFFLHAVTIQAKRNTEKARDIMALYEDLKDEFVRVTRSQHAVSALDVFFKKPIISSSDFSSECTVETRVTANTILRHLKEEEIIRTLREPAGRQPAIYALRKLLNIAEGRNIF